MKRVVVILRHKGFGEESDPIAVVEVEEPNDWRIHQWFIDHGWVQRAEGWTFVESGLYGDREWFSAVTDPMFVTEVQ